jgi:hypothetical protein
LRRTLELVGVDFHPCRSAEGREKREMRGERERERERERESSYEGVQADGGQED